MKKYLVQLELWYNDAPKYTDNFTDRNVKVTIGIYDEFDEACVNGNKLLENLESKFELHAFPDGRKATKERFSKNGGCFGSQKTLVTNLAYLKTPFYFNVQIKTLKYDSVDKSIEDAVNAVRRCKIYEKEQNENN